MALKEKHWKDIKDYYISGMHIREIARKYNISDSAIRKRIKAEGDWHTDIRERIIEKRADIKSFTHSVTKEIGLDHYDKVEEVIMSEVSHILRTAKAVETLEQTALRFHNKALEDIVNKSNAGIMSTGEGITLVARQGLSIDKIAARTGISKDKSTVNIQNNQQQTNESQGDKVIINIKGFE